MLEATQHASGKAKIRTRMSDSQASALDNCAVNGGLEGAWVHGPLGIQTCISTENWKWASLNAQFGVNQQHLVCTNIILQGTMESSTKRKNSQDSCSRVFIFKWTY